MKKHKILFVIESLSGGGAEKVLTTLIKNFDYDRYDVTVCSIVDVGKYNDIIKQHANYRYVVPDATGKSRLFQIWSALIYKLFYFWLPVSWAYRIFLPKGFDTEVAFIEGFVTKLMQYSKAKKVAWVHCDLKEYPWPVNTGIFKSLEEEKQAYAQYDEVAVVSESSKNHFIEIYGLADRTRCIYNPIDKVEILAKAKESVVCSARTKFRFITIGRLMEAKGFDRLIEAAARLKQDGFDFELRILGEGTDRDKLRAECLELRVDDRVEFLGFQTNPYKFLKQSDCFVCSSRTEGYSLVIAEAMCCGLPVISTRCAGPEEILAGGKHGMIVDNSTEGLYQGMKNVLSHSNLTELSALSNERAKDFDMNKTMNEIYSIIAL